MNKKGFTLIELILSMAIIGIIAVTLLPILNVGLKNIVFSGNRTKAVSEASDSIYNDSVLTSFTVKVKLPSLTESNSDTMVNVDGNKVTGTADIQGVEMRNVEFFIYRPNTY